MLVVATDQVFAEHDTGPRHPERPARLEAVRLGVEQSGLGDAVGPLAIRDATRPELERVHSAAYLDALELHCVGGGGRLDPDTVASRASWRVARAAAGAGLAAAEALGRGEAAGAFLAVRPPGHHALPSRAMGFCLVNNIAITTAALADRGERVCIVDYDAHHGNGTQEIFYRDPRVLYVSLHQWPFYPGTGALDETGAGAGAGLTCNLPLPAGATGDVYLRAFDEVVAPLVERFGPTWVLVSAGFDAHRDDPLTELGLSAGDFADVTARVVALAPRPGRVIAFLEGGYDLDALRVSVAASLPALAGLERSEHGGRSEPATSGGPGRSVVEAAIEHWAALSR